MRQFAENQLHPQIRFLILRINTGVQFCLCKTERIGNAVRIGDCPATVSSKLFGDFTTLGTRGRSKSTQPSCKSGDLPVRSISTMALTSAIAWESLRGKAGCDDSVSSSSSPQGVGIFCSCAGFCLPRSALLPLVHPNRCAFIRREVLCFQNCVPAC